MVFSSTSFSRLLSVLLLLLGGVVRAYAPSAGPYSLNCTPLSASSSATSRGAALSFIVAAPGFPEGFETGSKTAYASSSVQLGSGFWTLADALLGNTTADLKTGAQSARVRNSGSLSMDFDLTGGIGVVTIDHAKYGTDGSSQWELWASTSGGTSYAKVGSTMTTSTTTLTTASFTVNLAGNVRLQVRKTSGGTNRINFDNITVESYSGSATPSITTGTVNGSPFCVTATTGAAVSVPFTVTGGLTGSFAAQLSDAAGAFSADLTQNIIGNGTASPIAATLPTGTTAGTRYRIRVVQASSATLGEPNTADLTVSSPPSTNTVSLSSTAPQSIPTTGTGSSLTATAQAASTYAWSYATTETGPFTTAIAGATLATYTPKGADFGSAGTYYLVAHATSTCGSVQATSSPVTITVTVPAATVTATPNPVPDFGSVVVGSASPAKTITLSGRNLSGDVQLTSPAGFQLRTGTGAFSCAPLVLTPTDGSLSATVEVRFVPEANQAYAGTITVTSSGASGLPGIQVSGTGTAAVYPPSLSTAAPTAVTSATATTGGQVLEDGGSPVTVRGVAYATTPAPTTQDDFTQDGAGLGAFTSSLEGLLPNTLYYVRAYATNAAGTSYGEQVSFTTASVALAAEPTQGSTLTATTINPGSVTLDIRGGNGAKKLLLVTQGPVIQFQPTDGTTYAANARFGQGDQPSSGTYVVLAAAATSLTVTGLTPDTEYSFLVYDYNDNTASGAENYLLSPAGDLTLSTPAQPAALLLSEEFEYPAGDRLTAHGWTAHSVPGTNPILVAASGLSANGYAPAAGNAASLVTSGEDVNFPFAAQLPGTAVYASLLVRVSSVNGADYFFHLGPDPISTTFRARLFVKPAASSGKIQFGVSGSGTTTQYAPGEYNLSQTYLLVLRYTFGPGGTETRLYINPAQTEPATADASSTEAASVSPANIGSVALRQGSNTSPLLVDGLRISTSYALARPYSGPLPVTLTAFTARRQPAGGVQVQWATAQEVNARSFRVQRSLDGRTFTTVTTQAAAGTTSLARRYEALDATAPAAQLYYRLEQEDVDGTRHYSSVAVVAPGAGAAPAAALTVAPNPSGPGQPLVLHVSGRAGQRLTLQLLDNTGRLLHTQALRPTTDAEQVALTLPATLPAGTYLLRLTGATTSPLHTRLVLTR